ncbi:MAG: hypothetical protein NXI18_07245 [Alphaproteobacteria bacterium]|nr:hypothetical protein [Alphaproteobacteria bacterium]
MIGSFVGAAANSVRLLLPALFPSWRFFDVIGPSPRIEVALLQTSDDAGNDWHEVRPRAERLGVAGYLRTFFFNARWNETLFLVTCAEGVIRDESDQPLREIRDRLRADLSRDAGGSAAPWFRFRIVLLSRDAGRVRRDVVFTSPAYTIADGAGP